MTGRPTIPEVLHELCALRFSTVETASAIGAPVARLAQRIKEGRVPEFASPARHAAPGRGRARSFSLVEVYALRVIEELSGGEGGIEVASAIAILDRIRGVGLGVEPDFEHHLGWHPQSWPAEWLGRDMAAPVYIVGAFVPEIGWRAWYAYPGDTLETILNRLPGRPEWRLEPMRPNAVAEIEGAALPPMRVTVVNLTRALVSVDAVLSPLLEQKP